MASVPIIHAVDAAEAAGDVHKALALIAADLERRDENEAFWHPERMLRLQQLAVYGSVLPGWATSRWVLAQAVRWMDASQRERYKESFDRTVEVAGGQERYGGVDELDSSCKLTDYDWVYRQLVLYEYGGLQHFLDRVAARALLVRADGIRDWANARVGAFQLEERASSRLRWLDLSSGSQLETSDIGSASLLAVGEHAIGRLVPTETGPMFESAPLFVPPDVAAQVADAPDEWLSALERGCHQESQLGLRISTRAHRFPLLSDVPAWQQRALLASVVHANEDEVFRWPDQDLMDALVSVVHAAMGDRADLGENPFDPWPVVGSLLLEPAILLELAVQVTAEDGAGFTRLAQRLAAPAAQVCSVLADVRGTAA